MTVGLTPRARRAAAGVDLDLGVRGRVEVARPLPDVAGHVEQAVAVGRERLDRRRALVAVGQQVLPRELALPGVGHHPALGRELVAPGVDRAVEAAARGELPLGLGRQRLAGPGGVGGRVLPGDVGHGVALAARRRSLPGPSGWRHWAPGRPVPPVAVVVEVDGAARSGGTRASPGPAARGRASGYSAGSSARSATVTWPVAFTKRRNSATVTVVLVHPEAVDGHLVGRALLGVVLVGAHQERAAGDPGHVPAGRRGRRATGDRSRGRPRHGQAVRSIDTGIPGMYPPTRGIRHCRTTGREAIQSDASFTCRPATHSLASGRASLRLAARRR